MGLFLMGALGCAGLVFSWPVTILWVILLFVGWGILVVDGDWS